MKWDIFISHASEDKYTIAKPLAKMLEGLGFKVWLDEKELRLGDSLTNKINHGIINSQYGIIILSKAFLSKEWTNKELNSFIAMETKENKIILPIWHKVDREDIINNIPLLADKLAISTDKGIVNLAHQIVKALENDENLYPVETKIKLEEIKKRDSVIFLIDKQRDIFIKEMIRGFLFFIVFFIVLAIYAILYEKSHPEWEKYLAGLMGFTFYYAVHIIISRLIAYITINRGYKKGIYSGINDIDNILLKKPINNLFINHKYRKVIVLIISTFWILLIFSSILLLFVALASYLSEDYEGSIVMMIFFSIIFLFSMKSFFNLLKINKAILDSKLK